MNTKYEVELKSCLGVLFPSMQFLKLLLKCIYIQISVQAMNIKLDRFSQTGHTHGTGSGDRIFIPSLPGSPYYACL